MRFAAEEILPIARPDGFDESTVEKVLHLVHLLDVLNSHPALREKWVLKGGTALNLFVLRHPRLSVDIDLNYIGALEREVMLADRPKVERAAQAVFSREGFAVRRVPSEHPGGKWRLSYASFTGQPAILEVDFNFMYRQPLWEIHHADSHRLGEFQARGIPVLDLHELVAGKLSALFSRRLSRDLFDCHRVLDSDELQAERLRIAFVVYGGMTVRIGGPSRSTMLTSTARNWRGNSAPPFAPANRESRRHWRSTGRVLSTSAGPRFPSCSRLPTPSASFWTCCWTEGKSTHRS